MLGELMKVAQERSRPGTRRWFVDEAMELIVWYSDAGEVEGFELCYDRGTDEHSFVWKRGGTPVHARIDQGEELPTANRSPIAVPDGHAPVARVLREFRERSKELEPSLAGLVVEALSSFRP